MWKPTVVGVRPAGLPIDRWIVRMGIGYFSAAEGIVDNNIIHDSGGARSRADQRSGDGVLDRGARNG